MKYRKKPIVIEAVQLLWKNWNEICDFAGVGKLTEGKPEGCYIGPDGKENPDKKYDTTTDKLGLHIPTLEGVMLATENDWIIRNIWRTLSLQA